jgi:hypothetical protein
VAGGPLPELRAQTDAAPCSVRKRLSGGRPPPIVAQALPVSECRGGGRRVYRVIEAGSSGATPQEARSSPGVTVRLQRSLPMAFRRDCGIN